MVKGFFHFFDKLEDKVRGHLSHYPIVYAIVGGVGIVLFWRGVWNIADTFALSGLASLILGVGLLLVTGLFVSFFIGESIIITGLKREKKVVEKTEGEIEDESQSLMEMKKDIKKIERDMEELIEAVEKK
jgi:hypothetical protein